MKAHTERLPRSESYPKSPTALSQTIIAVCGIVLLEIPFIFLLRFQNLEAHAIGTIIAGLAAGMIYLIALYFLEHAAERRVVLWLIIGGALLFRLTLFSLIPKLSGDPYRYHWDGQIQLAGHNPYLVSPDTLPLGSHVTPTGHALPAHEMPNIYPPLAELIFRAAARFLQGPVAFKLPFFLADLLVMALLALRLRKDANRNFRLAIYAWNPLVIVEFAATGHSDALALAALIGAVLIIRSHKRESIILLAAAALLKVFPVMLFPLWLRRADWPRSFTSWAAGIISAGLAVLCFWPYRAALHEIPRTLAYFTAHWQGNNASLFSLLRIFSHSSALASGIGGGIVAGLAIWAAARRLEPERAAYLIFGAILLLSPNAYPWYFTWIVPFLCFYPNPAWLLLTILQFLSYHVLIDYRILGLWHWMPLMLALEYLPFYIWLAWRILHGRRSSEELFSRRIGRTAQSL